MSDDNRKADAYKSAGVDIAEADAGLRNIVRHITGTWPASGIGAVQLPIGYFANVIDIGGGIGLGICTDGVGSKAIIAEMMRKYDTIGIDCVAMNVNDLICVGAEPHAMVDYIAVEQADAELLKSIAEGLKAGAERAGIEIPGGELAQLPEMIKGHPSPLGVDLVGAAVGTVALDRIVSGDAVAAGDAVLGLPSSGMHSNGFTLARKALFELGGLSLDDPVPETGRSLADVLLEPTEIYVAAVMDLLESPVEVHGLAHITGDGLLNLLRLNRSTGYTIDAPLPAQPIFDLVQSHGDLSAAEMHEVFNMGTGFCAVVAERDRESALELLASHYPAARRIGEVTAEAGVVRVPGAGLVGDTTGFRQAGS